ncbi:hypothetical protein H9P43_007183 [Blastocladiella emersonii ATCC 22665]|nr:hypothetical protein H9P43_007183 [Blastocladiella emersonii ATCC 22665]
MAKHTDKKSSGGKGPAAKITRPTAATPPVQPASAAPVVDAPRKTLIQSYLALNSRTRLYFGLAGIGFSIAGLFAADYLEKNSDLAVKGKVDQIVGAEPSLTA